MKCCSRDCAGNQGSFSSSHVTGFFLAALRPTRLSRMWGDVYSFLRARSCLFVSSSPCLHRTNTAYHRIQSFRISKCRQRSPQCLRSTPRRHLTAHAGRCARCSCSLWWPSPPTLLSDQLWSSTSPSLLLPPLSSPPSSCLLS